MKGPINSFVLSIFCMQVSKIGFKDITVILAERERKELESQNRIMTMYNKSFNSESHPFAFSVSNING